MGHNGLKIRSLVISGQLVIKHIMVRRIIRLIIRRLIIMVIISG